MILSEISLKYDAYQAVEIVLPAGTTAQKFNFNDLPYLRPDAANIVAIEAYTATSLTNSPISNNALATIAQMKTASLTLYGGIENPETGQKVKQGNQIIQQVPVLRLNNIQNATPDPFSRNIFLLNSMVVDWTKSYIELTAAPGNANAASFVFGVYFNFKKQFN